MYNISLIVVKITAGSYIKHFIYISNKFKICGRIYMNWLSLGLR